MYEFLDALLTCQTAPEEVQAQLSVLSSQLCLFFVSFSVTVVLFDDHNESNEYYLLLLLSLFNCQVRT